jgi:hypothetical protein
MEHLTEEFLLRNVAGSSYARQALKKTQGKYSRKVEAKNMVDKAHSCMLEHVEV